MRRRRRAGADRRAGRTRARARAEHVGHAAPPESERLAALGARGDDEHRVAVERRRLDAGAEDRLRQRDRHLAVEVVALADEERVILHPRADDEIAPRPCEGARVTLTGDPDLGTGVHAGGNGDRGTLGHAPDAPSPALLAAATTARTARREPAELDRQ